MAITTIPVGFNNGEVFFIAAAEDFQISEDGTRRTNFSGDAYVLDISISAYVIERGLRSLTSQSVSLEVPVADADQALKNVRGLPAQTPVQFTSLTVRSGVSRSGSPYTIWTGRGMQPLRPPAGTLSPSPTRSHNS